MVFRMHAKEIDPRNLVAGQEVPRSSAFSPMVGRIFESASSLLNLEISECKILVVFFFLSDDT